MKAIKSKEFVISGNKKSLAGCLTMFCVTLMIFVGFLVYSGAEYIAIKAVLSSMAISYYLKKSHQKH